MRNDKPILMGKKKSVEKTKLPRIDFIRAALLAILALLIWCTAYNRWTVESWQTPLAYRSDIQKRDVVDALARIKAARDGELWPWHFTNIPQLGAPHDANWNDYPVMEKPLFCLAGLMAKMIGIFAAANLTVLLGQVLAAVSFYAACRMLNYSWIWAFAGALIFAFARFAFAHGLHHIMITYYWHLPLCLVVILWMMDKEGIGFGERRFIFALIVAFITGIQNIYYTNLFAQFVLFAGLVQGWRHGWRATWPALAIIGTAAAAFLLMNLNTIFYQLIHGPNTAAIVRVYAWMEIYGLKMVDLVVPPSDHPFPLFALWGTAHLKNLVLSAGEGFASGYLGIFGLGALAWLVVVSLRRVIEQEKLPIETFLILWIFLYAEVGGINGVLGTLGFQLFRAATRYSIFILCLVLMYAVGQLSSFPWKKTYMAYEAAILILLIALWDQMPPQVSAQELKDTAQAIASDRHFTERMEEHLPPNAMVFQLPIIPFPETPGAGIGAYDHFRPYLYSRSLRFSFGSDKGRPEEAWQSRLSQLSFREAVDQLENYGFSAIYLNRDGFPDRGDVLLKNLQEMGYTDQIESDQKDLVCVLIKPSSQPVLPAAY